MEAEILIVGGGVGGCAGALSACRLGHQVILTEETDWIGGQLTSQAVPPDEHPWIEQLGCTQSYRQFRHLVRDYYRRFYPLTSEAQADPYLNPGGGTVSRLCHEPKVALAVLQQMLAYYQSAGLLRILLRHRPLKAEVVGDTIRAVELEDLENHQRVTIAAKYFLDATELGDLLPLVGAEYVTGAESQAETGELHAVSGDPQPDNVQAFTWVFALSYDPQGSYVIDRPAQYERWRNYIPRVTPSWTGPLLDWTHPHPITLEPRRRVLFPEEAQQPHQSLWLYRRIVQREIFPPGKMPYEVTLVNWPQNDYMEGNIIDKPPEVVEVYLEEARQLSLSLLYWLQTEAPRPDEGTGYPGLFLRPDITGTSDGLAKAPYIREARRIKALFTVTEAHIGVDMRKQRGKESAEFFEDSVGVGCYRIDLHPSTGGDNYIDISAYPFQIPLGALIPLRLRNLLPAGKNIGTTHITNGCYRLHPVEWNIGESAGSLAGFCLEKGVPPVAVWEEETLLREFQQLLLKQGVEITWPRLKAV